MKQAILPELEKIKQQADFMIKNKEILNDKDIETFLKSLEKIRYDMFAKVRLNNKNRIGRETISYINEEYKAEVKQGILKIYIPEVLPKFKNISNYAYKNIMISTAEAVKDYQGLFDKRLTLVVIIVHEKQVNMDIDNKYVKPIIDSLVLQNIIQDDNISNMMYMVQGKNDTKKPYTEVFVMDATYMTTWLEKLTDTF